jgi:hypothetical protein
MSITLQDICDGIDSAHIVEDVKILFGQPDSPTAPLQLLVVEAILGILDKRKKKVKISKRIQEDQIGTLFGLLTDEEKLELEWFFQ